jgi:beta-lactamase class D
MKVYKVLIVTINALLSIVNQSSGQIIETCDDFKKYYDEFKVDGSFVMYDQNNDKYIFYNQTHFKQQYIPASTFKICNSLIGLETGVIPNENFIIPWDSVSYFNTNWNKDYNLKSAFKYSVVWYYQELARRVGAQAMKYWIDKTEYGNKDTSGGIDQFWLTGGLRITPEQQIDFLKRLYNNELPFSERSVNIVKNIMITEDSLGYIMRAKTGWGSQDNIDIGWYIGYLEANDNVYFFANCIQTSDFENENFAVARKDIVYRILYDLKLISK